VHESVAMPNAFGIAAGAIAVHRMFAGRGTAERVTVPAKSPMGFTTMVDVAGVLPSAGTTLGSVDPIVKSGAGLELIVQ
jgi:hypothetical protein